MNVHYIARKDNKHSKSGNINNMLSKTNGDLIAVFDADIFQKAFKSKIPAEQDFFMRDVQESRSYIDSEIHVGTNAVIEEVH